MTTTIKPTASLRRRQALQAAAEQQAQQTARLIARQIAGEGEEATRLRQAQRRTMTHAEIEREADAGRAASRATEGPAHTDLWLAARDAASAAILNGGTLRDVDNAAEAATRKARVTEGQDN